MNSSSDANPYEKFNIANPVDTTNLKKTRLVRDTLTAPKKMDRQMYEQSGNMGGGERTATVAGTYPKPPPPKLQVSGLVEMAGEQPETAGALKKGRRRNSDKTTEANFRKGKRQSTNQP